MATEMRLQDQPAFYIGYTQYFKSLFSEDIVWENAWKQIRVIIFSYNISSRDCKVWNILFFLDQIP